MTERRGGVGAQSSSPSSAVARRCGCGLGRLVRRLRRQAAPCAARPAASSRLRGCQYDPLSYARNFDRGGWPDDSDAAAQLYHSYTFSSRFVLSSSSSSAAAAAQSGLAAGRAPATVSH